MGHKTPQEGKGTVEIEKRTSKIPSGFYLAAGLTAMAASATPKWGTTDAPASRKGERGE